MWYAFDKIRRKGETKVTISEVIDLRELWDTLNAETKITSSQHDTWDDNYDDYVCCVGGYSD